MKIIVSTKWTYPKPHNNFQNYWTYIYYIINIDPIQIFIGLIQMAKINVSELLKILVWILPLANIFIEYQGHFLGLIWEDFKVGYFWTDFWGFQQTSIQLSEILDMMHECRCNYFTQVF